MLSPIRLIVVTLTATAAAAAQKPPTTTIHGASQGLEAHSQSLLEQSWRQCHSRFYPSITRPLAFPAGQVRLVEVVGGYALELSLLLPSPEELAARRSRVENLAMHQHLQACVEGSFARAGLRAPALLRRPERAVHGYVASWSVTVPASPKQIQDGRLVRRTAGDVVGYHAQLARWSCSGQGRYDVEVLTRASGELDRLRVTRGLKKTSDTTTACIARTLRTRLRFPKSANQSELGVTLH